MGILNPVFRLAGNWAAPGGQDARLTILFYHRVLPSPDPLLHDVPDARDFNAHMRALSEVFRTFSLDEALERLAAGTLPARSACVTFDDGYRDNFEVACPILKRYRIPATFYIASDFLDQGRMFNDTVIESMRRLPNGAVDLQWIGLGTQNVQCPQSRAELARKFIHTVKYFSADERLAACEQLQSLITEPLPTTLMMSSDHVRALIDEGMTVGGHTCSHPILARVSDETAWKEINDNRERLTSLLGFAPRHFAYPNGRPGLDFNAAHIEMIRRAGYVSAVTTACGVSTRASDPYQLPRLAPWHRDGTRLCMSLLRNALKHDNTLSAGSPNSIASCAKP